jgi:endonuclease III
MEKPETVKERLEDLITCENRLLYDHGVLIIGKTYCRKTNPKCSICPLEKFCMKNFVNV